jgi:phosphoribosylformylglycinamidine synthase subunit PurQ / glutaminase
MKAPKILVLRAAGTNCEQETANAFKLVGGAPDLVHISELRSGKKKLMDYGVLAIPGGFSYGDDVGAGRVLANQVRHTLTDLRQFVRLGRPVIGICNGFQVLVKAGILPHSFTFNDSGKFEARWVHLRLNTQSSCLFFKGLPEMIELPVAHGEGKLVLKSPRHLEDLKKNKSIALQYVTEDGKLMGYPHNPNGSIFNIAGLSNPEGNVLGLMPHPERFIAINHHPNWTRQTYRKAAVGLEMFKNAVTHAR